MTEQTPREIAFEDIKAGDDIEVHCVQGGVTYSRRGIAHRPAYRTWYTEAGGVIASDYDGDTITLHSRPAPAEPKGLGALMRTPTGSYIATNGVPGEYRWAWVGVSADRPGDITGMRRPRATLWRWSDFDPDTIEVLPESIEVES